MLINCPECSHCVSNSADVCPHCGRKLRGGVKLNDPVHLVGVIIAVFFVINLVLYYYKMFEGR